MDHETLAKVLIVMFVLEIIGVLIAVLIGVNTNSPALTGFSGFAQNINASATNLMGSLNYQALTPMNQSSSTCTFLFIFSCNNNPIGYIYVAVSNAIIFVVNIIAKLFLLFFNLFSIVIQLILLIGYLFLYLIPSLLISTGILGYILGLGYAFIVIYLVYVFAMFILEIVGKLIFGAKGII